MQGKWGPEGGASPREAGLTALGDQPGGTVVLGLQQVGGSPGAWGSASAPCVDGKEPALRSRLL